MYKNKHDISDLEEEKIHYLQNKLEPNISFLEDAFVECPDVIFKHYKIEGIKACLVYIAGLINDEAIAFYPINQFVLHKVREPLNSFTFEENVTPLTQIEETQQMNKIIMSILDGHSVLLIENFNSAIIFKVNKGIYRQVSEPSTEHVVRGPKEGFIENISVNIVLLRQKIRSNHLKIVYRKLGYQTHTNVAIVYMDNLVKIDVLKDVQNRLDRIDIDGILDSEYIEEFIEDNPLSPFPQILNTERPDIVAGNLLDGRVAILVDGSPFALIAPCTFWQLMQTSDDYYNRYSFASFIRILRLSSTLMVLFLPSMYIAVSTFHNEMVPTELLLTLIASREGVPFPAILEALMMEVIFEALREAGIRLPQMMGSFVGILGAIVIGTAAVQAGIVSAPMVIFVSLTGIASSLIPRNNLSNTIRLLRFPLMILSGILGLFGIAVGAAIILGHVCHLRSFGIPYLTPISPLNLKDLKDVLVRAPLRILLKRSRNSGGQGGPCPK